jgi:hypothetical protein
VTDLRHLRRHYDKFTVPERDKLLLAALARGDWDQVRALVERCPDAAALSHLWNTLVLSRIAGQLVIRILACDALFYRCLAPNSQAQRDGQSTSAAPDPLLLQRGAAAAWFGFVAWCKATGYDPHQLLNLALLGSEETNPARDLVDLQLQRFVCWETHLDPLQVDRWHVAFARLFSCLAVDVH